MLMCLEKSCLNRNKIKFILKTKKSYIHFQMAQKGLFFVCNNKGIFFIVYTRRLGDGRNETRELNISNG